MMNLGFFSSLDLGHSLLDIGCSSQNWGEGGVGSVSHFPIRLSIQWRDLREGEAEAAGGVEIKPPGEWNIQQPTRKSE